VAAVRRGPRAPLMLQREIARQCEDGRIPGISRGWPAVPATRRRAKRLLWKIPTTGCWQASRGGPIYAPSGRAARHGGRRRACEAPHWSCG